MLTHAGCLERQQRMLHAMQTSGLGNVVLTRPKTICYFTGAVVDGSWPHALVVNGNGDWTLVTNFQPAKPPASDVRTYTGYTIERDFGRESSYAEIGALLRELIGPGPAGIESEWMPASLLAVVPGTTDNLTPALVEMRRRKLPDEIESMRATIRLTEAGYAAIRAALQPGMTELDAYLVIESAIVREAGTSVDLKGDFACGVRAIGGGGPPTRRVIAPGDLCIYDLFPSFEGYMCDLCRTFAAGTPTDEQHAAWEHVLGGHDIARRCIRPGASTRTAYRELREYLRRHPGTEDSFTHHAGHGVGTEGWERPWVNAGSEGTFLEGEVIAWEPGLYATALQGGIRLEHNYLVTADGPEALDSFPMDLV